MTSLQIKLGRFCENSNAASLALSIKGAEGFCECVCVESAGADAAGGGSGQGGRSGCLPRFKMGGASEQAGALWDCVSCGGAEADCAGCDCGEDPLCALREIGALRMRASSTPLRHLALRPELKLRMIHSHESTIPILPFRSTNSIHPTASVGTSRFAFEVRTVPWRAKMRSPRLENKRIFEDRCRRLPMKEVLASTFPARRKGLSGGSMGRCNNYLEPNLRCKQRLKSNQRSGDCGLRSITK